MYIFSRWVLKWVWWILAAALLSPIVFNTSRVIAYNSDDCLTPADFPGFGDQPNWFPGSPESLNDMAMNPAGNLLAISTNNALFLYDSNTLSQRETLTQDELIGGGYPLAWSPDGTMLATFINPTIGIRIWDIERQQVTKTLVLAGDNPRSTSYSLAWSPDGTKIVAAGANGLQTRVWDVEAEKIVYQAAYDINPPPDNAYGTPVTVTWSPDEMYLAIVDSNVVHVLETATWTKVDALLTGEMRTILALDWSNGGYLAAVGEDYTTLVWDTSTWQLLDIPGSDKQMYGFSVSWSPDETLLAVGRITVDIIDAAQRKIIQQLPEHNAPVYNIEWLPDGKQLLTRSRDGWIFRWNLETGCVEAAVRVTQDS